MTTIAGFALSFLVLTAGMFLLAKTRKEQLGRFFNTVSIIIICAGALLVLGSVQVCLCKALMRCFHGLHGQMIMYGDFDNKIGPCNDDIPCCPGKNMFMWHRDADHSCKKEAGGDHGVCRHGYSGMNRDGHKGTKSKCCKANKHGKYKNQGSEGSSEKCIKKIIIKDGFDGLEPEEIAEMLNLSDEQSEQFAEIMKKYRAEENEIIESIEEDPEAGADLLLDLKKEKEKAIIKILNPEQKEIFEKEILK
ncbi:MAG: hypothetical protein KJ607_03075 [Bacteroidetes bacterium]|nr:hypothetical protein [Bacteroidota bacterium]